MKSLNVRYKNNKKNRFSKLILLYTAALIIIGALIKLQTVKTDLRYRYNNKIINLTYNSFKFFYWPLGKLKELINFTSGGNIFLIIKNYKILEKEYIELKKVLDNSEKSLAELRQLQKISPLILHEKSTDIIAKKLFFSNSKPTVIIALATFSGNEQALKNALVINDKGIVGKIIYVSRYQDKITVRIQTICDNQFRMASISSQTLISSIVKGSSANCKLEIMYYFNSARKFNEGEAIMSAVEEKRINNNLPLGYIEYSGLTPLIAPIVKIDEVEYMKILIPAENKSAL